jgi:hypothetical protein
LEHTRLAASRVFDPQEQRLLLETLAARVQHCDDRLNRFVRDLPNSLEHSD